MLPRAHTWTCVFFGFVAVSLFNDVQKEGASCALLCWPVLFFLRDMGVSIVD